MSDWLHDDGVACVVAPCCGFTFDAGHTNQDGGYSCPLCDDIPEALDLIRRRLTAWEADHD